jgi:dihydrofolate reductase
MRKVILACGMSLDGYIARPDGSVDFLPSSPDALSEMRKLFAGIDVVLFGRKTLDAAMKLGEPPRGPWTTYVFSRSHPSGEGEHGFIFVDQPPAEFVRELRNSPGKDILHMGGGELARAFLEADLIDELRLGIAPTLLGNGVRLFRRGYLPRKLTLAASKVHDGGLLALTYERSRE